MTVQLSVVMPVHDVAPWIEEQLDCVLRQDVDLEVIVIDDRSSDDTFALVERVALRDERVRLHRSGSAGGGAARNQGLDLAQGDYLVFADGDDLVPDGAYRCLVEAAESSNAAIAVGRHLKFSSGATWEPMASWYDVHDGGVTDLESTPRLVANRACWNRVFRTDFLRAEGIRFPDVARSNDIVPMVRAYVAADRIAVVSEVVYLYRERPGTSSMTARASSVDGVTSYLGQEMEVASLLADAAPNVRRAHAEVVLGADGYVHLDRFLRGQPTAHELDAVIDVVRRLLRVIPGDDREAVRAERRALWFLLANGAADVAVRFASAMHEGQDDHAVPLPIVRGWSEVIRTVVELGQEAEFALDREKLVNDGPLVLLANRAEHTDVMVLDSAVTDLVGLVAGVEGRSEVLRAVSGAVRALDPVGVKLVSGARHLAPLVVDRADPGVGLLTLAGPLGATVPDGASLELALTGPDGDEILLGLDHDDARWWLRVEDDDVHAGRHHTAFRIAFRDQRLEFTVVTARMPLPPVAEDVRLQPLADRSDGWRFLIDRRAPNPSVARRLLRAARATLGR
ncbi:glycosyltransferase involved in cell wall biosynthesis [Curtobacterium sp. PhB42]|uniref:glycosyltransferase family 2 protein n=1 Tax=unclassified Curtobacterium TaxID=257496 RepID=UPI001042B7F2|nr:MULTISPECIES: glycosyltransferase family A protein [unclassified Curtobacterium]TCU85927.1 glycosyltransferase involved in cell wall biosynthesis [Curtobacterium sp. PhB191]TDW45686.1 glycosyltransferase involved in cell wall biosynthesis [Curtobacterium sp. PhB42]TDW57828.1 glycosyltransferase involved in cell wall biosynthesis [Curtobacterium sp. PhB190]